MPPLRPEKNVHIVSKRRVAWAASGSRLMRSRPFGYMRLCLRVAHARTAKMPTINANPKTTASAFVVTIERQE